MTKYFVDGQGRYIGGFDGAEPPDGSIEIHQPPLNGSDIWDGEAFVSPPPEVPEIITIGQGKEALYNAGLYNQAESAIDAIEEADTKWRIQNAWNNRPTWERQSPFVLMMAGVLGLDEEQTDQLFIDAAKL